MKKSKNIRKPPSEQAFLNIVQTKVQGIEEEIAHLKRIKAALLQKQEQLAQCHAIDDMMIEVKDIPKTYVHRTSCKLEASDHNTMLQHLQEVMDMEQVRLSFGSYISVEKLKQGNFEDYDGIFTPLRKQHHGVPIVTRAQGSYLCGYLIGDWKRLPELYHKMFAYAQAHGCTLCGYAYEIGLNEVVIQSMEEYVTQVMIMIQKD